MFYAIFFLKDLVVIMKKLIQINKEAYFLIKGTLGTSDPSLPAGSADGTEKYQMGA